MAPRSLWIVASNGHYVGTQLGSILPRGANRVRPKGVLYLSAGGGRFYRFETTQQVGQLNVVGESNQTVTLRASSGATFRLDLMTDELSEH